MKRLLITIAVAVAAVGAAMALDVRTVRVAGPFVVRQPVVIDSTDAAQKSIKDIRWIDAAVTLDAVKNGKSVDVGTLGKGNADSSHGSIMLVGFRLKTDSYVEAEVKVNGPRSSEVFCNGEKMNGKRAFDPGEYQIVVKYVNDTASVRIEVSSEHEEKISVSDYVGKHKFSLADNMLMKSVDWACLSASGKYALKVVSGFAPSGEMKSSREVVDVADGHKIMSVTGSAEFMPGTDLLLSTREKDGHQMLVATNITDNTTTIISSDFPYRSFVMSKKGDFVIATEEVEGPKPEKDVHQILAPDDRIPGWRDRAKLVKVDLHTGLAQQLTFGYKPVTLLDISEDGQYILYMVQGNQPTKRPTDIFSVYRLELATMRNEVVVENDGFVVSAMFGRTNDEIVIMGSPEALNRIGCTLASDVTPSMYDYQIYVKDMTSGDARCLTRDFNPAVQNLTVNHKDGTIYFIAENEDSVSLYRMPLKSGKIEMLRQPMEVVNGFDIKGNTLLYYGTSACTPHTLMAMDVRNGKSHIVADPNKDRMSRIDLGTCRGWRMKSKNGYEITGHTYFPADFDSAKRYPVIVSYYGGCSPTSRRFGGGRHYPAHYWNTLGYIVLEVNPEGATGFGQEWSAKHVNTMGEGVAEDIIEATEWFARNSYVNDKAIGCVSASYGGFMTQCLLTKTDIFATGISHAGISDHTSYWGEGYWGYTYSQVCAANSYPWTRKDLFVDRSPLYNANKIHKPLLFTHGSVDPNVPIGESIQMYNALKLLGVPTAFVVVDGEQHGIMGYEKRIKWINTMMAWFEKWLKGDDAWWKGMYGDYKL